MRRASARLCPLRAKVLDRRGPAARERHGVVELGLMCRSAPLPRRERERAPPAVALPDLPPDVRRDVVRPAGASLLLRPSGEPLATVAVGDEQVERRLEAVLARGAGHGVGRRVPSRVELLQEGLGHGEVHARRIAVEPVHGAGLRGRRRRSQFDRLTASGLRTTRRLGTAAVGSHFKRMKWNHPRGSWRVSVARCHHWTRLRNGEPHRNHDVPPRRILDRPDGGSHPRRPLPADERKRRRPEGRRRRTPARSAAQINPCATIALATLMKPAMFAPTT
jgi:hypothetical protein